MVVSALHKKVESSRRSLNVPATDFLILLCYCCLPPGDSDYQIPIPTVTAVNTDHKLLLFPLAHELPQTENFFNCICLLTEILTG